MNKIKDTWKIFTVYILVIIFIVICGTAFGQSSKFCKQDLCVVEFNAGWNEDNSVNWLDSLQNCGVTRILITNEAMLKKIKAKYNIRYVPTIIVFNGKEVERFEACLRFKMGATKKEVQAVINEYL